MHLLSTPSTFPEQLYDSGEKPRVSGLSARRFETTDLTTGLFIPNTRQKPEQALYLSELIKPRVSWG